MTRLQQLHGEYGQSPWLDNLTRRYLRDGTLQRYVDSGIRGVTANPTILGKAIESSDDYDGDFGAMIDRGLSIERAYWELVLDDIRGAADVLRPTYDASGGADGFVSIEVAPEIARDTDATIAAARDLHVHLALANVFVKIPATAQGVPAIEAIVAEGRNINVTLIFSLPRYQQVMDAYLSGLERLAQAGGELSRVRSVASFFVSRVDAEVDKRLATTASDHAPALKGHAAIAQAKLAYAAFQRTFSGDRWERLAALGASTQRPLWASTSTKDPAYPDTMYVDNLIGPDTVNTMPEKTIVAFEDHGHLARRVDEGLDAAEATMSRLADVGISIDDVSSVLEAQGVASFHESFAHVLTALEGKAATLTRR
jgi:transaldolase